jgi:hypothetical protein
MSAHPVNWRLKDLHLHWRTAVVALALMMPMLTTFTDSVYATKRSSVYAAKHHASTRHVAKRRVVKQRKKVRSALMPPAPTDFGPHFDFPPASLNNGPTQAPSQVGDIQQTVSSRTQGPRLSGG